jgi:hypothetical protein
MTAPKIAALGIVALGALPATAQGRLGTTALTPVPLENPALLRAFPGWWAWVGYEPARFGMPELHWVKGGVGIPVSRELQGELRTQLRSSRAFSEGLLRARAAQGLTELFTAGGEIALWYFGAPLVPTSAAVELSLGVHGQLTSAVWVQGMLQNVTRQRRATQALPLQRIELGVGWQQEGELAAEVIAVIASSSTHLTTHLTLNTTKATQLQATFRSSPLALTLRLGVAFEAWLLEVEGGYTVPLGWSQSLALCYCW